MCKRVISVIISVILMFTVTIPAFSIEYDSISKDALMVSEEFAKAYPKGLFEFVSLQYDVEEDADTFDVIVVRRGGTSGRAEVDFKAVEVTAKYGEDFTILMNTWLGYDALKKETESPTLLESSLEENKQGVITAENNASEDLTPSPEASGAGFPSDDSSSEANIASGAPDDKASTTGAAAVFEEWTGLVPDSTDSTTIPAVEYKSSLHKLRDKAAGKVTKDAPLSDSGYNIFDIEDPEAIKVGDALNTLLPGVSGHLVFEDGENYKIFKVKIIDDELFEGPEQFTLGLYDPTGGAVLGDTFNTVVNISNNDEGQGQTIGFEQQEYTVKPADGKASLKVTRSGDIYTYAKIELSTISGTAMADIHYAPVITEAMFLPGETEKKIEIPILADEVNEVLSFEMVVTEDGAPTDGISRVRISILPNADTGSNIITQANAAYLAETTSPLKAVPWSDTPFQTNAALNASGQDAQMLAVSDAALQSAPPRLDQWIYIYGKDFAFENDKAQGGSAEIWGNSVVIPLRNEWYRYGSVIKYLDLRGISEIQWRYSNSGDSGSNNRTRVDLNGMISERFGNFYDAGIAGKDKALTYYRGSNSYIRFINETWWNNHGRMSIEWLQLKRQSFDVTVENGDSMVYSIWDGNDSAGEETFYPGKAAPDITSPYRDETITLSPVLSDDGIRRGAKLTGYQIKSLFGRYWAPALGTQIELSPWFIEKYIYNNGSPLWNETLTLKPVFAREIARSFEVMDYDSSKGTLKIGNEVYDNKSYNTFGLLVGDEMVIGVSATVGNRISGLNVYRDGKPPEFVTATAKTRIVLGVNTKIEPVFEKDTSDVRIQWEQYSLLTEPKDTNILRGMIFHDKPENMPQEESGVLLAGLERPVYPDRNDYSSEDAYRAALVRYEAALNGYTAGLAQNYPAYRERFQGSYQLKDVVNGDVVTLYAKPETGYTVLWWTNLTEDYGGPVSDEEANRNKVHVGSSFTYTVSPSITDIYYCFAPVSNSGNPIVNGKVVASRYSIKRQKMMADINNPEDYSAVPGVGVSVSVLDTSDMSKTIGGKTYKTSAVTDNNGNFSIYLPYSAAITSFSVKLINGQRVYAKSVPVGRPGATQTVILEIPFMDDYIVDNMVVKAEKSDFSIPIESKQTYISIKTRINRDKPVYNVRVRSYDSGGRLWKYWDMGSQNGSDWSVYIPNMLEAFKGGGRLTVELYDSRGAGHGEIEAGYELFLPPDKSDVKLPDSGTNSENGVDLDPIGNMNPDVELGTTRSLQPVSRNGSTYGTYSIAVGAGDVIKQIIEDNTNEFSGRTILEKINIVEQYLNDGRYSKNLVNKDFKPSSGNTNTGRGKGNITVNFDIGFYIQLTRAKETNDPWYFDYSIIYIAAEIKGQQDVNGVICGVPVYLRMTGGGNAAGLIFAQGNASTKIDTVFGYFPVKSALDTVEYQGRMKFNINIGIGVGFGRRGILSAGGTGRLDFDIGYQPWQAAKGVLTFSLSVDIDIAVIPISFKVYSHTWPIFEVGDYQEDSWVPSVTSNSSLLRMAGVLAEEQGVSSVGELERAMPSSWNKAAGSGLEQSELLVLQSGIYKHPDPKIVDLGDGGRLLFFINDVPERGDYDRTAVYCSRFNKQDKLWEDPFILQNDGTSDYDLTVKRVGDRIITAWSSYSAPFGSDEPELAKLLGHQDIYAQFFNLDGTKDGDVMRLTFDEGAYGNGSPEIAYDEATGDMIITYIKTDYSTDGVEFDENHALGIGDYLHNSYSTIAYRKYDGSTGSWLTGYEADEETYIEYEKEYGAGSLYGQRFIDISLPGEISARVRETALSSHNGKAFLAYSLDVDQDWNTGEDTDLFMLIYDFGSGSFTNPVRITDDTDSDTNPREAEHNGQIYLFWNNDGYISYIDLDAAVDHGIDQQIVNGQVYYTVRDYYRIARNVMDERNNDAAESFNVEMGEDGNLYIVWNESSMDTVSQGEGMPDSIIQSRDIYIAMYDDKFEQLGTGENGEPVYAGKWGGKWKLTENNSVYYNEQAVTVDEDGALSVACRRFIIVPDDGGGNKEADMSSLVVMKYKPVSTLSIKDDDIMVYPVYPNAGDNVTVYVNSKNFGFKPSEYTTFKFELYDKETDEYVPIGDNITVYAHTVPEGTIPARSSFIMPDDISDVRLRITAWEEEFTDSKTVKEFTVASGDDLVLKDCRAYFYGSDSVRLQASLVNNGNMASDNVNVTVKAFNSQELIDGFMKELEEGTGDNAAPVTVKTLDAGVMQPSGVYLIDEIIDIDESYLDEEGDAEFRLHVTEQKEGGDVTAATGSISVRKTKNTSEIAEILVNDGQNITFRQGTSVNINAAILPVWAAGKYGLNYSSIGPDIVEIDPSSGMLYGKRAGTAEVRIEAVKYSDTYFVDESGLMYDPSGELMKFENDGTYQESGFAGTAEIALTKTVNVTVTDQNQDPGSGSGSGTQSRDTSGTGGISVVAGDDGSSYIRIDAGSTLDAGTINRALGELEKLPGGHGTLLIAGGNDSINIGKDAVAALVNGNTTVTIQLAGASINLDQAVLQSIAANGDDSLTISIRRSEDGGRPVVDIDMLSGDNAVTAFGGRDIMVSVPYTPGPNEDKNALVVYYVDDGGGRHIITNGRYSGGMVTFRTNHLSRFAVGYNKIEFYDVSGWAEDYISFLAARDIITGAGRGRFEPGRSITRAEFVKMLAVLSGDEIKAGYATSFRDIPEKAWYASYVGWAHMSGYVNGKSAGTFAPDDHITREQMAVIIDRFIKDRDYVPGSGRAPAVYTDSKAISPYAADSVASLGSLGLVEGKEGGRFEPAVEATRAECAKILAALIAARTKA